MILTSDCVYSARPSAPKELKYGDITKDSVHLTWEPPDDDGGSPLTGYLVEKREVSRKTWTKVSFFVATHLLQKSTEISQFWDAMQSLYVFTFTLLKRFFKCINANAF